jgi:hypothetical protein
MKIFKSQALYFVVAALTFGACKPSLKLADASIMIPNTAGRVVAFNPASFSKKIDKEDIRKMSIFKMLSQDDNKQSDKTGLKSMLKDLNESGIDFQKKIYLVTEGNQMYCYFLLNDTKKFNQLFKKNNVKTEKGICYVQEGEGENERMRLAWKGNVAIVSIKQKGNLTSALLKKNPLSEEEMTPLSMQELFSIKRNNCILETPDFQKAMLETHDISGFSPFGRSLFAKLLEKEPFSNYALSMTDEQREAIEKASVITYTDFNNGEIISKSTYNVDPSLTKDLRKLFAPRIAPEMMPLLNHQNLLGTFNLNFSFEGIAKMLSSQKDLPFDVNQRDSSFNGLSPMEMISAFDGSILAGVYKGDSSKIKIVLATKINNPALVRTQLQKSVGAKLKQVSENTYIITKLPKMNRKKAQPEMQPDVQEVAPAMPPDDDAGGIGVDSLGNAYLLEEAKTAADTTQNIEIAVDPSPAPMSEGDTEMVPDLPSKRKKSPLGDMKMDRLVLKDNLMFLTDSSMVESLQNGQFFNLKSDVNNAQLGEGQMNMYFNFSNLIKVLPPSVGAMTAMIGKFPINDLHINMNGKESFLRLKTASNSENSLLTILKTIDRVAKMVGSLKPKKQGD